MAVLGQFGAVLVGNWWYWVSIGWNWLVCNGNGSVLGGNGWYLVVVGQYSLVLVGIMWYWIDNGVLCLYILKKLMVMSTDRPTALAFMPVYKLKKLMVMSTDRPTKRANVVQSAFSKVRK